MYEKPFNFSLDVKKRYVLVDMCLEWWQISGRSSLENEPSLKTRFSLEQESAKLLWHHESYSLDFLLVGSSLAD